MRFQGTLVEWNDARGFGFVQADTGGDRLFVHISAFQPKPSPQARPQLGMRLEFTVGLENGKKRAQQVAWRNIAKAQATPARPFTAAKTVNARGGGGAYFSVIAFVLIFLGVAVFWNVQRWVASLYAVLSLITFFAYWKDKAAAQAERWRTPESTLHTLALLGGWPGGCFCAAMVAPQKQQSRVPHHLLVHGIAQCGGFCMAAFAMGQRLVARFSHGLGIRLKSSLHLLQRGIRHLHRGFLSACKERKEFTGL